mgnify:CR=1 FL=1
MSRRMPSALRYLILADGAFGPQSSKTANACIRYTPERVVGVVGSTSGGGRRLPPFSASGAVG